MEIDEIATLEANTLNEVELMFDKAMQMEMYLLEQTSDVYHMYADQISREVSEGGHTGLQGYMRTLLVMDE